MGGKEIGQNSSDMQPVRIRGVIEHPDCAGLEEKLFHLTRKGLVQNPEEKRFFRSLIPLLKLRIVYNLGV